MKKHSPKSIASMTDEYLSNFGHIHEGEIYILIQLNHDKSKHYIWKAPPGAPFGPGEVISTELVFE